MTNRPLPLGLKGALVIKLFLKFFNVTNIPIDFIWELRFGDLC